MVDIGCQISDSVVEHLLPQRGLLQRLLGFLLAALELGLQPVAGFRIVDRRHFGIHGQRQMLCRRTDLGEHLVAHPVVLPGQHLVAEELHDGREVGLLVEFLVVELDGVAAQQRRRWNHRHREACALQVRLVGLDDLPPVRVEVGLGRDKCCDGADFERLPHEGHLGFGELLAGVADHQHGVSVGQQSERGGQMRLAMTANAGGVDEHQPTLEQRAVRGHRDSQDLPATGRGMATQIVLDIGDRDLDGIGLVPVDACDDQFRRGRFAVGHHRGDHRRLVVANAGHRHIQQRVEQLALALLELAGDHDADLWVGDTRLGLGQPLDQIATLVRIRNLAGVVDQFDDDLDLAGVVRLRHGVPFICRRRCI